MAGALDTFDVASVLQAVSLSRQHTSIRFWGASREETGELRVKSGQLLHAAAGELRGRAAFQSIIRGTHHRTFRVERLPLAMNLPEPIGPLARLLLDVPEPSPPPPPPKAIRTLRSTPTPPPSESSRVVSPQRLAELLEPVETIHSVVLEDLSGSPLAAWSRGPTEAAMLNYARGLIAIHRTTQGESGAFPTAIVQFPARVIMVEALRPEVAVVYAFAAGTPMGMARWVAESLRAPLTALV